jgi:type III secretion protein T
MQGLPLLGSASDIALLLGLSTTRVAVALLLVPLFTTDLVPTMVRNAMFVSIALLGLLLQPLPQHVVLTGWQWFTLYAKEAFIGASIGFLFAGMMWAFEAAGQVIDSKIGATQAQLQDPLTGQQTTLNGAFLARLASYIFMAGGGFMLMVGTIMESFGIWPVAKPIAEFAAGGREFFTGEFGRIMVLTVLISSPALVLLYVIDGVLGLVNRFAQQLNVISLSMSLKATAGVWIVLVQLTALVQLLQEDLLGRGSHAIQALRHLLS